MKGVLIISPFFRPNIGGVETHLTDLTNLLSKRDHKVFVLTYTPITTKIKSKGFEKHGNLEIRRVTWFGRDLFHKLESFEMLEFIYLVPVLLLKSFLFMLSHRKQIDVIHVHGFSAAAIGRILKLIFKKRIVMSSHSIYNIKTGPVFSRFARFVLSGYDKILALSRQSKLELSNIGIKKSKINVYTYWVNQDIFKPLDKKDCKKILGWEGRFVVLFVGRFLKIKGMELLMNVSKKMDGEILFAFIGDGPERKLVESQASSSKNIAYVGSVPNNELNKYYNASDVFCIPSLYEEGFGRVILEALTCGVPVVGTKLGGIQEAVDDSVGILVEPEEKRIQDAIEYLFKNPQKLELMKSKCREYAKKRFSEKNIKVIEKSYVV
jgi:glycosyltransferase involved in cell wall biosynthesis